MVRALDRFEKATGCSLLRSDVAKGPAEVVKKGAAEPNRFDRFIQRHKWAETILVGAMAISLGCFVWWIAHIVVSNMDWNAIPFVLAFWVVIWVISERVKSKR